MVNATRNLLLVPSLLLAAGVTASADAPIVTVTACDEIELGGHAFPRFTLRVQNPDAELAACELHLDRVALSTGPEDSCSWVAGQGPAGWQTIDLFPGKLIFIDCPAGIPPGESLDGFRVAVTRPCCFRIVLANTQQTIALEQACFQCAIPANASTWGSLKSRYR